MTGFAPDLLAGQVAVVTGGSSGLGRETALRLGQAGVAGVVVADVRHDPRDGGTPTIELLAEQSVRSTFVACDVRSSSGCAAAVEAADVFGGVTIMVPAAGVLRQENVLTVTESDLDATLDVNVKGAFFSAQAAARSMLEGGRTGSIVLISSVAGHQGSASMPTYNMSKGAVRMLTYSLAASLGPQGIRVNAVHPGIIRTSMTMTDGALVGEQEEAAIPLRRFGDPSEVADAIVYLASPLASYVNGASLFIDGGAHSTKAGRQPTA